MVLVVLNLTNGCCLWRTVKRNAWFVPKSLPPVGMLEPITKSFILAWTKSRPAAPCAPKFFVTNGIATSIYVLFMAIISARKYLATSAWKRNLNKLSIISLTTIPSSLIWSILSLGSSFVNFKIDETHNWHQLFATLEDGSMSCLTCGSRFTHKSSARRHYREIHALQPQSQETCPICSNVYKTKRHLTSHLRTNHGVRPSDLTKWAWASTKSRPRVSILSPFEFSCVLWTSFLTLSLE